jgi:hypothetical protein
MNREEIITNIQNKLNSAYMMKDREKVDEIIRIVFDEVEKLKQPVTLAEFLGWEENEIYIFFNLPYMVKDDELCFLNNENEWRTVTCYRALTEIKQRAKKVEPKKIEPKKYYFKLKEEYIKFICKDICNSYLNFKIEERLYFLGCNDNVKYKFQTKFTDEEIKNIKLPEPLTIDMFEKIEVE